MSRNVNFKDLTNQKFGYLTAISLDEIKSTYQHKYWICECVCGNTRSLQTYQLTSGKVTSCGCMNAKTIKSEYISDKKRIFNIYNGMRSRCCNSKSTSFKYYGEKGITICDEWLNDFKSFVDWAYANGYNDSLSIDRIDNSRGYCPDNCRWIALNDQFHNKTNNVWLSHNGETHTMSEWSKILNFSYTLAKSRKKEAKNKNIEPTFEYIFAPPKFIKTK